MTVRPNQCNNINIKIEYIVNMSLLVVFSWGRTAILYYQDNENLIFNIVNFVIMYSKSLNNENDNDPNSITSMTQTTPKEKAKCLC